MSGRQHLQVNVTAGPNGMNYTANRLPPGEKLVATLKYERAPKGNAWLLEQAVTTGATIFERKPSDEKTVVSYNRIDVCIDEFVRRPEQAKR